MASHAPIRTETGHVAPPRGRGRPKGSANLTPEERRLKQKTGEIDYTRVDNKFNRPEEFAVYVAGYPDKTGIMASLYRQQPKIDVTLIGLEEFSIHKTIDEAEMSKEWIGDNFGRGKYMLMLSDSNRPHGQKEVATTFFDITAHPKPPVYDPRTLVLSEPKNLDEVNRQVNAGVMVRDRNGQARFRTHEDGPVASPVAMPQQRTSDVLGEKLMEKLVSRALGDGMDANNQMSHVIEVAKLLQQQQPQQPSVTAQQVAEIVTQTLERGTRGNGDMFENYEKMETFVKKFSPAGGAVIPSGEGLAQTWGTVRLILGDVITALPQVLQGLAHLQSVRNQERRRPHPMRRVNTPPAVAAGEQPQGPQQPPQALMTLQERAVEVVTMGFDALARGTSGRDFASFLFYFHPGGDEILELLASQGGTQAVMGLIAMSPEMAKLVGPQNRPQVEKFLNDVLAWEPEGAQEEVQGDAVGA